MVWNNQERAKETTLAYLPKPANGQEIGLNNMRTGVSSVIAKIFNDLVYTFFKVVRSFKDKSESTWKAISHSSENERTPHISGILKKSDLGVTLTGTGKELFYLLSKGATPIICGEGLFLISHISSELISANAIPTMEAKLAQIDENTRNALIKHYKYPEEKSYGLRIFGSSLGSPFSSSPQIIPIEELDKYYRFDLPKDFKDLTHYAEINNARN